MIRRPPRSTQSRSSAASDVYKRQVLRSLSALALEPNLGAGVNSWGDIYQHLPLDAHLSRPMTGRARLRRNLSAAEAHRTWTVYGESTLPERDHSAAIAFGTDLERGAERGSRAMTGAALFTHLELDRNFSTPCGGAEWNVWRCLCRLSLLGSALTRGLTRLSTAEHRAEEIAEPAQTTDVEVLEVDGLRTVTGAPVRTSAARGSAAATKTSEATVESAEPPHLIVLLPLFGIAKDVVRLRDLLEALGFLRVAGVRVGMVLLGELAIRLLDLVLRGAGAYAEYGVEILRRWHVRSARERGQPFHCFTTTCAGRRLSLIHISEPTRLGMISYAV